MATELAAGQPSTYDTVRAYEAWIRQTVEYDLNAPLPAPETDAVHDLLFESNRGFCEQIASALAIMLRTQGVPTRVTTGYVSGTRDPITGVFEVRASDAHAWVEVWFPETGWQPFDPTANVPLAGDAEVDSVGVGLITALGGFVGVHRRALGVVALLGLAAMLTFWLAGRLLYRRRRGRWGVLQDRFARAAERRGARPGATNPEMAARWASDCDGDVAARAEQVAGQLDRVSFDPGFVDDDREYGDIEKLMGSLDGAAR